MTLVVAFPYCNRVLLNADTDNDVAGLFVRGPNGLCVDFEDLAEEVMAVELELALIPTPIDIDMFAEL